MAARWHWGCDTSCMNRVAEKEDTMLELILGGAIFILAVLDLIDIGSETHGPRSLQHE